MQGRFIGAEWEELRWSAAKCLRESGIHEKLIMDIGDWKTRSIFDCCTITDPEAMRRAMEAVTAPMQSFSLKIAPDSLQTSRAGKVAVQ